MKSLKSVWSRWMHNVKRATGHRPRRRKRRYHLPTESCLEERVLLSSVNFTQQSYSFTVQENAAQGTAVGTPQLTENSAPADFFFASGNEDGAFAIDVATGEITVSGPIDYESTSQYTLEVWAMDPVTYDIASTTVTVNVADMDDAPYYDSPYYAFFVDENAAYGTVIGTVSASNPNGVPAGTPITYYIESDDANGAITLDPTTGELTVSGPIDFESGSQFDLYLGATNGYAATGGLPATVYINDVPEDPVFSNQSYSFSITENAAYGASVGTVAATNPNGVPAGAGVTYAIASGNEDGTFSIDPNTGEITVSGTVDFEAAGQHTLSVVATNGYGSSTAAVTVNVTDVDEDPYYDSPYYAFFVDENAAYGTVIGTVSASNPNGVPAGTPITYYIESDDANGAITLDPTTGELTVSGPIDFESDSQFTLYLGVTNGYGASGGLPVTVYVNDLDEDPVFSQPQYVFNVPENKAIGELVGTIAATNPNGVPPGTSIVYSIESGNETGHFSLDPTTGKITVAKTLDFETTTQFTLTVSAFNGYGYTGGVTVTINVQDVQGV